MPKRRSSPDGGRAAATWLLLAVASCGMSGGGDAPGGVPEGWSRVDVSGEFSLLLPPDLEPVPAAGADSLVRRYRSKGLVISIDYGRYSNSLADVSGDDVTRESVRVDGRPAELVRYRKPDAPSGRVHVAALHVPAVDRGKLTLVAHAATEHERERAVRIALSLRFSPSADDGAIE